MPESNKLPQEAISESIKELEKPAQRPRYLVFCAGLSRESVHAIRDTYRDFVSQSSGILAAPGSGYDVKIYGFYDDRLEKIFKAVGLTPNLLILGQGIRSPYPKFMKTWLKEHKPSVLRIDDEDGDSTLLPHDDYYLSIYSVLGQKSLTNTWRISNEIDYGILLNLNYRREVKIEDYDHHTLNLGEVDLDSNFDAGDLHDTKAFLRSDIANVKAGAGLASAAAFFGSLAASLVGNR